MLICDFLVETFEFTEEQNAALDYQVKMTQTIFDSIWKRCDELGEIADGIFARLIEEFPEFIIST